MSHGNKKSLRTQASERMREMCVFKEKDEIKRSKKMLKETVRERHDSNNEKTLFEEMNDAIRPRIYSYSSYMTYMRQSGYFLDYCSVVHGCKTMNDCEPYINEWLQQCVDNGRSASTIHTRRAALGKLFQKKIEYKPPIRKRSDIKRSRRFTETDSHFSESKNYDLVEFCRSTGLRRFELEHLKPEALVRREDIDASNLTIVFRTNKNRPAEHLERHGAYFLRIKGKGGRIRYSEIVGDVDSVIRKIRSTPSGQYVWGTVSKNADIHSYRRDYAKRVYEANERTLDDLAVPEKYYCRNDRAGYVYDRKALRIVSEDLGHSRICVVADHYLGDE